MFSLRVKSSVKKDIKNFSPKELGRIAIEIKALKSDPLPPGAKKIKKGKLTHYRIRVGYFRIGYCFDPAEKSLKILYIKRRSETTYT